jgi:hypothetical protein
MKSILTAILLLSLLAASPLSRAQTAPPQNSPPPSQAENKDATPRSPDQASTSESDPRHCLELATNMEIHVCAEKYRPRRRAH